MISSFKRKEVGKIGDKRLKLIYRMMKNKKRKRSSIESKSHDDFELSR